MSRLDKACVQASQETGLHYSVFVGDVVGETRPAAERLHAALGAKAPESVLVVACPGHRRVEVVTGAVAARRVPDRACALAALSMTTAFTGGDLVGGLLSGVRMLADTAGATPALTRS